MKKIDLQKTIAIFLLLTFLVSPNCSFAAKLKIGPNGSYVVNDENTGSNNTAATTPSANSFQNNEPSYAETYKETKLPTLDDYVDGTYSDTTYETVKSVEVDDFANTTSSEAEDMADYQAVQQATQEAEQEKAGQDKKKNIIIAVVLTLLVVGGIVLGIIFGSDSNDNDDDDDYDDDDDDDYYYYYY